VPVLYAGLLVDGGGAVAGRAGDGSPSRLGPPAARAAGAAGEVLAVRPLLRRRVGAYVALSLWLPAYYRVFRLPLTQAALRPRCSSPGQPAAAARRLALRIVRRAARHCAVFVDAAGVRTTPRAAARSGFVGLAPSSSSRCWGSAWASQGVGLQYIADPNGRAAGGWSAAGRSAALRVPLGPGYLDKSTGPESCFG
jgi:hypothetical protein